MSNNLYWLLCPIYKNKTRIRLREDTVLEHFPLFCPKCKCQSIIDLIEGEVTVREAVYRQEKE